MREAGASTFANVAASATDTVLVPAVAGARIEVLSLVINHGDTTSSTVVFNSKGSGAGTAVGPTLKGPPNGGFVLGDGGSAAWFRTNKGEGLSVTTGAGSTTGIGITYRVT